MLTRKRAIAFMLLVLLTTAVLRIPSLQTAPPGLHYDEAANALLAADIGLRGDTPIFISSYTGKETLFFYAAGGMMRLVGESVFSLRLTAVYLSILTIAAAYWMGREMMLDRRISIIAAALLAVSFWHLLFSRLGFRAISQPLLQALTIAALLRGLRKDAWGWLAIGGLFLGATAYTYLAARLFPLLLLLSLLPVLSNRQKLGERWQQLIVFGLVAALVLAPLAAYFISNPAAFWVRIGQVAPAMDGLRLRDSFARSFSMFFLKGDPYWRFNVPERPLFSIVTGTFLLVGWANSAWRLRKVPLDWQRFSLLIFILAPIIMLLPTALAVNEIVPSNLRAIGMIPFVFYLPAIGLNTFLRDLDKRYGRFSLTNSTLILGFLILWGGGLAAYRAYLLEWARTDEAYFESDGDLTAVAEYLNQTDLADKQIFIAALHYQHPTIAFLSDSYDAVKWLPESQALVFPAEGESLLIYPHSSPPPAWATAYLPDPISHEREDSFTVYAVPPAPDLLISQPMRVNFGNAIVLDGVDVATGVSGGTLPVTLYWHVLARPSAAFKPFIHVEDAWGERWSGAEPFAYPTAQWEEGDVIIQRVTLPIADGTPPGQYRLRVGLFDEGTGQRLPKLDADGRFAGSSHLIEDAPIAPAPALPDSLPTPRFPLDLQTGDLHLLGYERGASRAATGEPVPIALWWQADAPLPKLTTRIELYPANAPGRILLDTQPIHDSLPFDRWTTPTFLIDHLAPRLPEELPAGGYTLHLRLMDENSDTVLEADLGALAVETTERLFTPPSGLRPLDGNFSDEIVLLGYTLTDDGRLQLVWQASQRPSADYTVFVHLLNPDGSCCAWQQDRMPVPPSSRWVTGEVIVDEYGMDLPADGGYRIEIGLYLAETGQRLQVTQGGRAADLILIEKEVVETAVATATSTPSTHTLSLPLVLNMPTVTPSPTPLPTVTPLPTATPKPAFPVYEGAPLDYGQMGIQMHIQQTALPPLFDHVRRLGVGWVKTQVSWKLYQPYADQYAEDRFAELDEFVRLAEEAGVNVMLGVSKAPEWSRPTTEMDGAPTDYALFGDFMGVLATRYQGRVAAYELWNEANLQREWNGTPLGGGETAQLMRAGATAVRQADPSALLISGAPAVTGINDGVTAVDDRVFMRQLLNAGTAAFVDGIGVHPYGWANPPDAEVGTRSPAVSHNDHPSFFFRQTLDEYAALLNEFGTPRPLWPTEFGWATFDGLNAEPPAGVEYMNQVDEWQQAVYTMRAFEMGQERPFVAPMILWNLNFGAYLGTEYAEAGYGLLRGNGSERPVYLTIEDSKPQGGNE